MKVNCAHGFFKFFEDDVGDISDFISLYGFDLVSEKSYFTFSFLKDAPKFSIKGKSYLGLIANKTFEGEAFQVMKENGFVYDFNKDLLVDINSVSDIFQLKQTNRYFISNGMILPGSVTDDGSRVKDYAGFYDSGLFKYSEVSFV